jgi:hypothetical protein
LKRNYIFISVVALILAVLFGLVGADLLSNRTSVAEPDVYFGVDVGFGDEADVYRVADAVQGYANLIIIGSTTVTTDTPKLTRVCDYLYARGFSFIVYVDFAAGYYPPAGPAQNFFNETAKRWGDKFLGAYVFDEIGGKQLDFVPGNPRHIDQPVKEATNYTDAAIQFVHILYGAVTNYTGPAYYNVPNMPVFTSDYGLYWFDYLFGGYNVVLGEFTGNQSRQLTVALNRGAAYAQHMRWGTMITWKYDQAPFLEDAAQLYDDMILAYENGADYIVVFDSPGNQSATTDLGILTSEHLDAMRQFWNYALENPRIIQQVQVAYVLPTDYGFGFRGPDDTIWGLWIASEGKPADPLAPIIWNQTNSLIEQCGTDLDIVYAALIDAIPVRLMYQYLVYWNGTVIGQPPHP